MGVPGTVTPTRPPDSIFIGRRARKDLGDLESLARSIDEQGGLLQPIVIKPDGELIGGERRLRAWALSRFAGEPIPVHVVDIDAIGAGKAAAEYAENYDRKAFTLSEQVVLWREVEPALKEAARRRSQLHGAVPSEGRLRDDMKRVTGKSGRTLEKAIAIVEAAERDPAKFEKLVADMDRNGADGAYRRLRNMQAAEMLRAEPPPLPMAGPYRVIVIDPPWPAEDDNRDPRTRGYYPYPTMPFDEILALPIDDIAHPEGCAVWLWVNNFRLANGDHATVLDAWGFIPSSTILTWAKSGIGQGQRLRGASEHCVLAVRGKVPLNPGADGTWFEAPRGEHSEKPAKFFEIVERVTPASRYASLFAGKARRDNWDMHGDRIGKAIEEAAQ